jgi:outer membrane receptor protein involved in Fe transport
MSLIHTKSCVRLISKQVLYLCIVSGASALYSQSSCAADASAAASSDEGPALEEITVTATRREEGISRVPISITALSQEAIDDKGIHDFSDVVRFTPGVAFDSGQTNQISIRGISSSGGSGTTGIYIDDVPIQVRNLGFNSDDALIKLFDLDRLEVLRGPQGTLFGAGSEGGTVRYITNTPSLTQSSVYAKAETAYTEGGSLTYETGIAGGMPIIDGVFGVRFSAYFRHDGGWIDRIDPTTLDVVDKNANSQGTSALRLAGLWKPNDAITVSPSITYQNQQRNDVTIYWPEYSNPSQDRYASADPTARPIPDVLYLPALNIKADLGPVTLISTTSYFHRDEISGYDGTLYNLGYYQSQIPAYTGDGATPAGLAAFPLLDGSGVHLPAGLTDYRSPASVTNTQRNITQEFRLQSNDPTDRLQWTAGVFYSLDRQYSLEEIHDPMADTLFNYLFGEPIAEYFETNPVLNPDGSSYLPMGDSYFNRLLEFDRQIAGFGEVNFQLTDTVKLTAGVRISKDSYTIESMSGGPQNGATLAGTQSSSEQPVTPRAGIEWQADPNDLFYFTYSKGFRPGGGNPTIPYDSTFQNSTFGCTTDFDPQHLNLPNGAPATYKSDSTKSFEVGAKNNIDNRVRLATSIYYIKWNNIQQNVVPPICQIQFTDNLGNAVSKGFDLQADVLLPAGFSLESSFGYTDARYTTTTFLGAQPANPAAAIAAGNYPVVVAGDAVAGPNGIGTGYSIPPYSISLGLEYKFRPFGYDSFARADWEYLAGDKWEHPAQDPNTASYDSTSLPTERQSFASLRAGTKVGNFGIQLFVDNLMDSHTILNYNHQTNTTDANGNLLASPAYRYISYRPRTFGIDFTFRE